MSRCSEWGYDGVPESKGVLGIPSRVIATSFALVAFAAAAVMGVYVGNDIFTVLWRAAVIMLICYLIGRGVGAVAQWTVDDHISRYRKRHPIPGQAPDEAITREPASGSSPRTAA